MINGRRKIHQYAYLILINLLYAFISMVDKLVSQQPAFSVNYFLILLLAFALMGVYAFGWQKLLHIIPLSDAYMFKGLSLVFIMILSYFFWHESITVNKLIGTGIIVVGIYNYARK